MSKRIRIQRTREDLQRELTEQLELLRRACADFDIGFEPIAKHIALSLRVLLHEHGQSRSLLDQLGLRTGRFLDTAGPLSKTNLLAEHNLVAVRMRADEMAYVPLVASGPTAPRPRLVLFVDWWNNPVIKDADGRTFCRRELVSHVANTDGGAHVDPELDEAYMALSRQNSLGWIIDKGDIKEPFKGRPELACIRQIAHEVLSTLHQGGSSFAGAARPVLPPSALSAEQAPEGAVTINSRNDA